MELCDLNLDTYIHRLTPPGEWESIPYFIKNSRPPIKAQQIWNVMRDISSGVKYIHSHDEVHRDLKPANSTSLHARFNISSLLSEGLMLEVGGFWSYIRGHNDPETFHE
jgi:hypothetical protein